MKRVVVFLIVASTASLLACGKPEDVAAPAAQPPAAQAGPAPATAPEPDTPVVPPPPAAPLTAPETQPVIGPAQPAVVKKPAAARPEASPAQSVAEAAPSAPASDLAHGQQIYRQACAFCHDKGVAGAPKTGDAAAWSPRLAQGMDTLYASSLGGKGAMPAKGGNRALTDADVRAAVDYLVAQVR